MFSVQQIYLDLNTAGLSNTQIQINGLSDDSKARFLLDKHFICGHLSLVKQASGKEGVLLGAALVKSKPGEICVPSDSLVPMALNIMISSYKKRDGSATGDPQDLPLYTLNYLIMSEKRPIKNDVG